MKNLNKIGLLFVSIGLFFTSNISAQYNASANEVITGTVDANGEPNQLLSAIVGGTSNTIRIAASGVTITNVIFDATGAFNGIEIDAVSNVTIDNVIVRNANGDGLHAEGSRNLSITNSSFFNNGLDQDVSNVWAGVNGYNHEPGAFSSTPLEMRFAGIRILSNTDLLLEGNATYGNSGHGIKIETSSGNSNGDAYSGIVRGNIIGSSEINGAPDGNFGDGLLLINSNNYLIDSNHSLANGNRSAWSGLVNIATDPSQGLDSRQFYGAGIELNNSNNNTVINNIVGTTYDGKALSYNGIDSTGNQKHGIYVRINSANNQIGQSGLPNIVGGNGYAFQDVHTKDSDPRIGNYLFGVAHGITIHDDGGFTRNNNIQSNFIGYYDGACIPNRQDQVSFLGFFGRGAGVTLGGLGGNLVGGATAELGNVIGGGEYGIFAQGSWVGKDDVSKIIHSQNILQGNFIGVDENLAATSCIPNLGGIVVQSGAVNLKIAENVISNIDGTAIEINGTNTNTIEITENVLSCNAAGIDLVNVGNNNFGISPNLLAVNTAASTDDLIVGFSPNATDRIDVYIADSCTVGAEPCQAGGDPDKAQGLRYITTFSATPTSASRYADEVTEDGYFEYDLTNSGDLALNHDNIIFLARDVDNNTSEFHRCVSIILCEPPVSVDFTSPLDVVLCEDESTVIQTSFVQSTTDDSPLSEFIFELYALPNVTTPVQTMTPSTTSTSFTVDEAGEYVVRVYNNNDESECELFSSDTVSVSFSPTPSILNFTGPTEACVDQMISLTLQNATANSQYDWTVTPVGGDITLRNNDITAEFTFTDAGDYEVSVLETNINGCFSVDSTSKITLTINPLPTGVTIGGDKDVCVGDEVIYLVEEELGFSYDWTVTAPGATVTENPNGLEVTIVWGENNGLIELTETNQFGCVALAASTLNVNVNALPNLKDIDGDKIVCAGDELTYSVLPTVGSTFTWIQDGVVLSSLSNMVTIIIPEEEETELSLIEQNAAGCISPDTDTLLIEINERPVPINLTVSPGVEICEEDNYSVSVDAEDDIEFIWMANPASMITNNSVINKLDLVGIESGTISVSATNKVTGCKSNDAEKDSVDIIVNELPEKPTLVGKDTVECVAVGEVYSVQDANVTSNYTWTFSDVASSSPLNGTTSNVSMATVNFASRRGTINVIETDEFGCKSELETKTPVIINCDLSAQFTVNATEFCFGDTVVITEQAEYVDIDREPLEMFFVFGDSVARDLDGNYVDTVSVSSRSLPGGGSVTVVYDSLGFHNIGMIVMQQGKIDSLIKVDVVEIKPLATLTAANILGDTVVCQNDEVDYRILNPTGDYSWWFDGATALTSLVADSLRLRFDQALGDVTIKVIEDRNGCFADAEIVVDVLAIPDTLVLVSMPVCEGEDVIVSIEDGAVMSTYEWTPMPDSLSDNGTVAVFNFQEAGNPLIKVFETNVDGCTSQDTINEIRLEIKSIPNTPVIGGDGLNGVCQGVEAAFSVPFNANLVYNWNASPDVIIEEKDNEIIVTPIESGERSVTLSVTDNGCTSAEDSVGYLVESIPEKPVISALNNFCEGSTMDVAILNPNDSSTYTWEISMTDYTLTDGSLNNGPDNNKLLIELGSQSGTIRVVEWSTLLCESLPSDQHRVNVKKILGDDNHDPDLVSSICSDEAYDSLATYEISIEEASEIRFYTEPFIKETVINGSRGSFDVAFPEILENTGVRIFAEVNSIIGDSVCDTDVFLWNTQVRESYEADVMIEDEDFCEGDSGRYIASLNLNPQFDSLAVYTWLVNDEVVGVGEGIRDAILIGDLTTGDKISVIYSSSDELCVNLSKSDTIAEKIAIVIPSVDLSVNANIITDDGVTYEGDDIDGYGVYKITSQIDVEVEAELVFFDPDVLYTYQISYEQDNLIDPVQVNGTSAFPIDSRTASEVSSTLDLPSGDEDGQAFRWYKVNAFVGGQCPKEDSSYVKLIIEYSISIPDIVCAGCSENGPTWPIKNIDEFPNAEVVIFNRWGGIVKEYSSGEYDNDNGWDGTNENGSELPVGTYFYTISLGNDTPPFRGPITLIR